MIWILAGLGAAAILAAAVGLVRWLRVDRFGEPTKITVASGAEMLSVGLPLSIQGASYEITEIVDAHSLMVAPWLGRRWRWQP